MDEMTAQARRLYHHVHNGGVLKEHDVAIMVEYMECKDAEITSLRERLEQAERAATYRDLDELISTTHKQGYDLGFREGIEAAAKVVEAAKALRNAQRAYMDDRGNDELGRAVASAAEVLDRALAAQKGDE